MQNVPLILETPGAEPEHGAEVQILKKLRAKKWVTEKEFGQ